MVRLTRFRGHPLTPSERIECLCVCVDEVFGYGHLTKDFIDQNHIDIDKLAKEHNWKLDIGVLTVSFYLHRGSLLIFGQKPEKKIFKRLVKEAKQAKK
jgi:hypothetical protein